MGWFKVEKPASGTKDVTSVLICTAGDRGRRLKIGRGVLQQVGDGDVKKVDVEVNLAAKTIRISSGQTYQVSINGRNWRSITIERALQALGEQGVDEPEFEVREGSLIIWPSEKREG